MVSCISGTDCFGFESEESFVFSKSMGIVFGNFSWNVSATDENFYSLVNSLGNALVYGGLLKIDSDLNYINYVWSKFVLAFAHLTPLVD